MKKFVAILLAILMAFTSTAAIAAGAKSPTVNDLYRWTPAYTWTMMHPVPTMADVEFAKETIVTYLGENYNMVDAFNLYIAYPYAIVKYDAPYFNANTKYLMILTNDNNTYFLTPYIINDVALFDFTNIKSAWYKGYILYSEN